MPPDRRSRLKVLLMVLLVAAVAGAVYWANTWKGGRRVEYVRVRGNVIVPEKEILTLAGVHKGGRLFDVDLFVVRERVRGNAFIRSASVNRDVHGGVTITVVEREPVAAVVADRVHYLDTEGMVLPHVRSENLLDLPVITGPLMQSELIPGRKIKNGAVREALTVLDVAREVNPDLYHRLSEVHVDRNQDMMLYTAEHGVPVHLGRANPGVQLVLLDAFWNQIVARRDVRELHYIDLRFDDQVVARWEDGQRQARKSKASHTLHKKELIWTTSL